MFACAHTRLPIIMGAHVAGSTHIYASSTPNAGNVSGSDLRRRPGDGNRPLRTAEGSNLGDAQNKVGIGCGHAQGRGRRGRGKEYECVYLP